MKQPNCEFKIYVKKVNNGEYTCEQKLNYVTFFYW